MARQRDPNGMPGWLSVIRQPGVIEVLACLANHGPTAHAALCTYVDIDDGARITARAVRRLAAWGMCQRTTAGSWDNATNGIEAEAVYVLTDRGHEFVQALATGARLVKQLPPDFRATIRRQR